MCAADLAAVVDDDEVRHPRSVPYATIAEEKRARTDVPWLLQRCRADGLAVVRLTVEPSQVVYVLGVLEASEGLGAVLAERGGALSVVCHPSCLATLRELLADLARELPLEWSIPGVEAAE